MVNGWVKVGKIGMDYISVKLESLSYLPLFSLFLLLFHVAVFFFLNSTVLESVTYGTKIGM